ncbi:MAG: response regulator transcription factor [Coriobacteriia bacterium]|nr:response regulator transcription factor [Coriobacteriia bacterium]
MSQPIYYVEDDLNVRNLTIYALEQTGLEIKGFSTANELYAACAVELPDLFILDIMLPGEDGISILKRLRNDAVTADIPIMMLTARGTEYDVVTGLDTGADDYIRKPFSMMELVSRVKALLRRHPHDTKAEDESGSAKTLGKVVLCPKQHSVEADGEEVSLANKEFELLHLLMQSPGQVFSREQILEAIWGWTYTGNTRTVDVHIQTLRQKLGSSAEIIETVRGVGYRARDKS